MPLNAALVPTQPFDRHLEPRLLVRGGRAEVELASHLRAVEHRADGVHLIRGGLVAALRRSRAGSEEILAGEHAVEARGRCRLHVSPPRVVDLDDGAVAVEDGDLVVHGRQHGGVQILRRQPLRLGAPESREVEGVEDAARVAGREPALAEDDGYATPVSQRQLLLRGFEALEGVGMQDGGARPGRACGQLVDAQAPVVDVRLGEAGQAEEGIVHLADAEILAPQHRRDDVVLEDAAESRLARAERARTEAPLLEQRGERDEGDARDDLERDDRQRVLHGKLRRERPVAVQHAPRGERSHQKRGSACTRDAESHRRPHQYRERRVEQRGRAVRAFRRQDEHPEPDGREADREGARLDARDRARTSRAASGAGARRRERSEARARRRRRCS